MLENVKSALELGWRYNEIARVCGVSRTTLWRLVKGTSSGQGLTLDAIRCGVEKLVAQGAPTRGKRQEARTGTD